MDDVSKSEENKYSELKRILDLAYAQAAFGKGKERHANDLPFTEQPIMKIGAMVGVGGHAYQIMKKSQEACGMVSKGHLESAKKEMLGAIVYASAMVLLIEQLQENEK